MIMKTWRLAFGKVRFKAKDITVCPKAPSLYIFYTFLPFMSMKKGCIYCYNFYPDWFGVFDAFGSTLILPVRSRITFETSFISEKPFIRT